MDRLQSVSVLVLAIGRSGLPGLFLAGCCLYISEALLYTVCQRFCSTAMGQNFDTHTEPKLDLHPRPGYFPAVQSSALPLPGRHRGENMFSVQFPTRPLKLCEFWLESDPGRPCGDLNPPRVPSATG